VNVYDQKNKRVEKEGTSPKTREDGSSPSELTIFFATRRRGRRNLSSRTPEIVPDRIGKGEQLIVDQSAETHCRVWGIEIEIEGEVWVKPKNTRGESPEVWKTIRVVTSVPVISARSERQWVGRVNGGYHASTSQAAAHRHRAGCCVMEQTATGECWGGARTPFWRERPGLEGNAIGERISED